MAKKIIPILFFVSLIWPQKIILSFANTEKIKCLNSNLIQELKQAQGLHVTSERNDFSKLTNLLKEKNIPEEQIQALQEEIIKLEKKCAQ